MIFYSTGDTSFNTTAPTGSFASSGWQWVGSWIGFQAAPIGPHHFLAARHVGGSIGDVFVFDGVSYTTVAYTDDTVSDLRIWQVSGTFPTWAPLYRQSNETGRTVIVFGRGKTRGSEVLVDGMLKGWMWGSSDGQLRWGLNTIASVVDGGSYWGSLLYATFDQIGGTNEVDLAQGDSSAPCFINDGTGWKLAGVGAAVDAYFNTTNSGNGFVAALFDARGLYYSGTPPTGWALVTGAQPVPAGFYLTQVSVRAGWIDGIVPPVDLPDDVPALSTVQLVALAGLFALTGAWWLRRRRPVPAS